MTPLHEWSIHHADTNLLEEFTCNCEHWYRKLSPFLSLLVWKEQVYIRDILPKLNHNNIIIMVSV